MYQELRKKIMDIYNSEDVVSDDKFISVYDLIKATNIILKPWHTLKLKKTYIDRINEKYQQKNKSLKQLKAFVTGEFESKVFVSGICDIDVESKVEKDNIIFYQTYPIVINLFYKKYSHIIRFRIGKYANGNEMFIDYGNFSDYTEFEKEIINEFINNNSEIIYQVFSLMEEYCYNFGLKDFNCVNSELIDTVNDGFFEVLLNANSGKVQYNLKLFSEVDNDNLYREWVGLESLSSILTKYEKEFLKKIMIPIENLNDFYKKIVMMTHEKVKTKTLKIK